MGARQHTGANRDRTHRAGVAAIDARFARQDLAANDARLQLEQDVAQLVGIGFRLTCGRSFLKDRGGRGFFDRADALAALLLVARAIGLAHVGFGQGRDACNQRLVAGGRLPVPLGFAGDFDELINGLDHGLHLIVAEDHRTEHHILGQLVRLGLDHHHG